MDSFSEAIRWLQELYPTESYEVAAKIGGKRGIMEIIENLVVFSAPAFKAAVDVALSAAGIPSSPTDKRQEELLISPHSITPCLLATSHPSLSRRRTGARESTIIIYPICNLSKNLSLCAGAAPKEGNHIIFIIPIMADNLSMGKFWRVQPETTEPALSPKPLLTSHTSYPVTYCCQSSASDPNESSASKPNDPNSLLYPYRILGAFVWALNLILKLILSLFSCQSSFLIRSEAHLLQYMSYKLFTIEVSGQCLEISLLMTSSRSAYSMPTFFLNSS